MSRHLRRILGALLLASLTQALAQGFDLTTYLGFRGVVKDAVQHDDGTITITTFAPNGDYATVTTGSPEGTVTMTYRWDPTSQVLEVRRESDIPPLDGVSRNEYGFNEAGLETYNIFESSTGTSYYEYRYAADGSTRTIWFYLGDRPEGDGRLSQTEHFDDQGRVVHIEMEDLGLNWAGTRLTYEEHGQADTIESYDMAGDIRSASRFEYELDDHGNWTKRIQYRWVERLGRYETEGIVTTRDITYF